MLAQDTIQALARELYDARKNRQQLRHFSKRHPAMTVEDGYAIQRAWVALERAEKLAQRDADQAALLRTIQRRLQDWREVKGR